MTDIATARTLSIHTSLVVLSLARLLLQLQMLLITSTTIVCFLFSEGCVYDGLIWEFGSREVGWGGVGCYEASKCDNLKEKPLSLAANQSKWQSIPFGFSVKQWAHPNGTSEFGVLDAAAVALGDTGMNIIIEVADDLLWIVRKHGWQTQCYRAGHECWHAGLVSGGSVVHTMWGEIIAGGWAGHCCSFTILHTQCVPGNTNTQKLLY